MRSSTILKISSLSQLITARFTQQHDSDTIVTFEDSSSRSNQLFRSAAKSDKQKAPGSTPTTRVQKSSAWTHQFAQTRLFQTKSPLNAEFSTKPRRNTTVTMDLQVHYVTPQSITVQQTRATPPGRPVAQLLTPGSLVSVSKVTEDKIVLRNRNRSL